MADANNRWVESYLDALVGHTVNHRHALLSVEGVTDLPNEYSSTKDCPLSTSRTARQRMAMSTNQRPSLTLIDKSTLSTLSIRSCSKERRVYEMPGARSVHVHKQDVAADCLSQVAAQTSLSRPTFVRGTCADSAPACYAGDLCQAL